MCGGQWVFLTQSYDQRKRCQEHLCSQQCRELQNVKLALFADEEFDIDGDEIERHLSLDPPEKLREAVAPTAQRLFDVMPSPSTFSFSLCLYLPQHQYQTDASFNWPCQWASPFTGKLASQHDSSCEIDIQICCKIPYKNATCSNGLMLSYRLH